MLKHNITLHIMLYLDAVSVLRPLEYSDHFFL